jgi:RNA polymerase sigma-70 factor (ECF subfamily)
MAARSDSTRQTASPAVPSTDLEAIYRAMLPRIYGYILLRIRGQHAVAEDLTQDVFLAFARTLSDGPVVANPTAWLFGAARHKVVDHHRTLYRHEHDPLPGDDDPAAPSTDSLPAFETVLDRAALGPALDRLPDLQRLVVLLRYADGLPVSEIAELTGKSEHAIEAHLVRARRALRTSLSTEENER